MKRTNYRPLVAVLAVLLCAGALWAGWLLFDAKVDRSGWGSEEGIYFYRDFHGKKVTGWQEIDGNRYYFGEDFAMATLWQAIDGQRYYFGNDGALDSGWLDIDGNRYHTAADGVIQTGWQEIDYQRYYFDGEGILQTGWLENGGNTYYLGFDGAMALGMVDIDGDTYYFSEEGTMHTGALVLNGEEYLFGDNGMMHTGWLERENAVNYYLPDRGILATYWQEIDGKRYYFGADGVMYTGWLQEGEYRYYLLEDGAAAVGPHEIDGQLYYFTPKGIHVILVNSTHKVPANYDPNLVKLVDWHQVSEICLEPLQRMLADCEADGNEYTFNSGYRTISQQRTILEMRTEEYEDLGYDYNAAYLKARETVALPGTSEHHLGLAVDILGADAIAWLHENCWQYGFILRYTEEKEHITGFVDEPWHFRYVGKEVAMDMKDSGLCLEEYLGAYPIE